MAISDDTDALPDAPDGGLAKYLVRDAMAIRGLLRRVLDQRGLLTAEDEHHASSAATALLQVDEAGLWIDVPQDANSLKRLVAGNRVNFEGRLDRVTLRFHTGAAQQGEFGGRTALRVPLPAKMLHLQRREYVRLEPPGGVVRCLVPVRANGVTRKVPASIRDIGGGGLAVLVPEGELSIDLGDVLRDCELALPGNETLVVDLCVRHLSAPRATGPTRIQAGCEFVNLPPDAQVRLMRYIMQLDRDLVVRRRFGD